MNKEEYQKAMEEIQQKQADLKAQELKIVSQYINDSKKDIPWGTRVQLIGTNLKGNPVKIEGFIGGWTIDEHQNIIPVLHKITVKGEMNQRSIYREIFSLADYTITPV